MGLAVAQPLSLPNNPFPCIALVIVDTASSHNTMKPKTAGD